MDRFADPDRQIRFKGRLPNLRSQLIRSLSKIVPHGRAEDYITEYPDEYSILQRLNQLPDANIEDGKTKKWAD